MLSHEMSRSCRKIKSVVDRSAAVPGKCDQWELVGKESEIRSRQLVEERKVVQRVVMMPIVSVNVNPSKTASQTR